MRVRIVAAGRIRSGPDRSLLSEYYKRIGRYCRLEEIEVRDEIAVWRNHLERFRDRGRAIALEVSGELWTSDRFGRYFGEVELAGLSSINFFVGGAYGLPPELSDRVDQRVSLGRITLPHRLARVVLAEQIYRAFSILRNEPYSH